MPDHLYNVLFLCSRNSARSIFGEAILKQEGQEKFNAFSAGSEPQDEIHPYALDLLRSLKHPLDGLRSKDWQEFAKPRAPKMDFVFTVCDDIAAEVCLVWPGHPMRAHWGVIDPVAVEGTEAERRLAFAEAYRMLRNRIVAFVNLPISSLDGPPLSLWRSREEPGP